MSSLVSDELRRRVAERADHLCEYCLIHEDDGFLSFQVDHIVSRKHGGTTTLDNLAFACAICNRMKGSDIGTLSARTGNLVRFFNPRTDGWTDHFRIAGEIIEPLTEMGEGTAKIFEFNHPDRVLERQALIAVGRFPSIPALARMRV